MGAAENAALARRIYDFFNTRQFEAALALTDDAAEIVNIGRGATYAGKAGFLQFMQGWKTLDPDCRVDVLTQLASDDGVTNECIFHATQVGPLATRTGDVPPTGRTIALPFCEVWRIKDGKLVSLHNYADGATVMAQLGLLPS